ncbi:Major capsid protein, partial [Frankliniella fusca]
FSLTKLHTSENFLFIVPSVISCVGLTRGSVHLSPFFLLEAQIRTLAGTGITLLSMDRYLSLIHRD